MRTILVFALVMLAPGLCVAQDAATDALRKGIIQEETSLDLNPAIQTYQSVVALYESSRQAATTALFRMAECYRKQGKSKEAIAAYGRVIKDFADQTKVADQSRNVLAGVYQVPEPRTGAADSAADPAVEEARSRYRSLLVELVKHAKSNWDHMQQQFNFGAVSYLDTYEPQAQLTRAEGVLAAFDAGMVPRQSSGPATPEANTARKRYRELLQLEISFESKAVAAGKAKYELGAIRRWEMNLVEMKLMEAQARLAAFDAGLAPVPASASAPERTAP